LNGKVYIIGGFDESNQSTTTVEVYDPIADKWTTAAPLPQPLDHTAAASYDGKLYVVGGGYLSRDALSNKLFIYDPTINKWTEGADLQAARGALTGHQIWYIHITSVKNILFGKKRYLILFCNLSFLYSKKRSHHYIRFTTLPFIKYRYRFTFSNNMFYIML
jgi:N-acetylneuraminic acid mutarotase